MGAMASKGKPSPRSAVKPLSDEQVAKLARKHHLVDPTHDFPTGPRKANTAEIEAQNPKATHRLLTGCDVVLVDGPDLHKRVREATGGAKLMLGIDAIGGPATDHIAACLSEGGTLVNYGLMSGQPCQVSAASFVFRDVTLRGFWLAKWFQKATPAEQMKVFGELTQLIASGKLKARIAATYSVAQIKEAVAAAASGERDGKILIVP